MNKETVQKNVYILHLNYRTVYCPKKALNCEMGNTVMANRNSFRARCRRRSRLRAILGWCRGVFLPDARLHPTGSFFLSFLPQVWSQRKNNLFQHAEQHPSTPPVGVFNPHTICAQYLLVERFHLSEGFDSLHRSEGKKKKKNSPQMFFIILYQHTPLGDSTPVFVASWVVWLFSESV